jgi:flagellar basal body-associated protein FliL
MVCTDFGFATRKHSHRGIIIIVVVVIHARVFGYIYFQGNISTNKKQTNKQTNSLVSVCKQTIPTKRLPVVVLTFRIIYIFSIV